MTHRHRRFWREPGSNKIFSHCYCGVDIHMNHIKDGKAWAFKETLAASTFSALTAFSQDRVAMGEVPVHTEDYSSKTIHPEVVMDTTGEVSDCEECESIFGLKVLGDV